MRSGLVTLAVALSFCAQSALAVPVQGDGTARLAAKSNKKNAMTGNRFSPWQRAKGYLMEMIAPGVWRIRFGTPEKITPAALRTAGIKMDGFRHLPAADTMPFPAAEIGFRSTGRGCLVDLPLDKDEQVFGFGMNFKVLNATGLRRALRVTDAPETDTGDSHAPVPFYVSTRGYGVYVDTARWAQFYCGDLQPSPAVRPAGDGKTGPVATSTAELYRPRDLTERRMTVDVPAAKGVDVYVFAGPSLATAVQRYVLFSGGGCLPPLWGLGVWYRCSADFKADDALKMARDFRDKQIPCDVFGLEPGWQSHAYSCSFVWNRDRFPDPKAFIDELSALGFHLNLWEHAFTHSSSPIYDALKPHSGDYLVWSGLVPDFADPKAREIFGKYHETTFVKAGVSGFKLDECDNQPINPRPWSWPEIAAFPSGADGEQMHSLLPTLYQDTLLEAYRRNNLRTYGQVRASQALAAPLPFVLYSDAYDHRSYVRGIVTCGLSGTLWQPEVRDCDSVEELYRRIQTAVCSPQTLVNAWYLRNFPWRQIRKDENNRGELMPGYEAVEATVKQLFQLRMSLVPYLYSAFAEYHSTGKPPFRPLVMDDAADPNTWTVDDEYMMGDSLLVAPMFTGEKSRSVYLPAGNWYSFYDGQVYEGHRKHEIAMGIERIPIFVREGAIIPLAIPVEHVAPGTVFDLTVHVYGPHPSPFTLYSDDGVSFDFERGRQSQTVLKWSPARHGEEEHSGNYPVQRYRITGWKTHGTPQ